jgi:hypothetical protein
MNDTSRADDPHYTSNYQPDPLIQKDVVREINAEYKPEEHTNDHNIGFEQLLECHLELYVSFKGVVHELNHFLAGGLLVYKDIPLIEFFKERSLPKFWMLVLNLRSWRHREPWDSGVPSSTECIHDSLVFSLDV